MVLVVLGFGLGLSSVSPWSNLGVSAEAFGVATIAWIAFTQLAASAVGGYLAGRLRVKWASLHTDEVYFRDTAHGFMAWAIASLVTAAFLGSALTGIVGGTLRTGANVAAAATGASAAVAPRGEGTNRTESTKLDYFVDGMFRKEASAQSGTPMSPATRAEALGIFTWDLRAGALPDEDRQYLGGVIAQETGLPQAEGEKRATDKFNQAKAAIDTAENNAKQLADTARRAAAHSALWMFVALMLGAFFASLAGTFGGRRRDAMV